MESIIENMDGKWEMLFDTQHYNLFTTEDEVYEWMDRKNWDMDITFLVRSGYLKVVTRTDLGYKDSISVEEVRKIMNEHIKKMGW